MRKSVASLADDLLHDFLRSDVFALGISITPAIVYLAFISIKVRPENELYPPPPLTLTRPPYSQSA